MPTFCRILKNKSVKGLNVKPQYHLAAMMNCLIWVFYGMLFISPGNILVLTAYGIGLAIQLPYLIIILLYANNNKQRMYVGGGFLIELVTCLIIGSLIIRLAPTVETRRLLVELSFVLSAEMVGLAEVSYYTEMIRTKSVESVEIRIVWGKTLYALCWSIYGLLKFDLDSLFVVPQVSGFFWGVLQLVVYDVYYKDAAAKSAAKSAADKNLKVCRIVTILYYERVEKSAADKKLATAEVQVQGMGTGADKLAITGADKKLAIAGMGTGAGKKLAIDPLQLQDKLQENGTA